MHNSLRFMRICGMALLVLVLVSGILFEISPERASAAATYYVSPSGSDSNSGAQSSPWRNFSYAASRAVAGDTVVFMDGSYGNEGKSGYVVRLSNSGAAGSSITFRAQNRGKAILDGGQSGNTSCNGAKAYIDFYNSSYIVIDGFVIQNTCDEAFHNNDAAHHLTISHNDIRNIANVPATDTYGRDGMYANAAVHDLVIDGNIFHDIGRSNTSFTSSLDHALYLRSSNVAITNNIFYNQRTGWDIQLAADANNVLIANNVFASRNPGQNGQIMVWDNHSGLTIRNNVFYNPPGYAVTNYTSSVSSCSIDTNIISNGAGVFSGSGCAVSNNRLNVDPMFVNASAFDFHLGSGSPAIDAGAAIPSVATDIDGTARPVGSGYDIGAYEKNLPSSCISSNVSFQSKPFSSSQSGSFRATFDAIPGSSLINAITGLSSIAGTTYADLAAIVRFNPSGFIDARNGANYVADASVPYVGNSTYRFRLEVNVPSRTYSAFVTPPGGSEVAFASNYAFRSEQAGATSLSYFNAEADSGSHAVCNLAVVATDTAAPSVPTGLVATAALSSQINLSWNASTDNVGVTGYRIYRDGVQVGISATNSYSDTGLAASTVYTYTVSAGDAAGNWSAQSGAVSGITKAGSIAVGVGSRVVATAKLNIRSAASISSKKLGSQSAGAMGTVIGGPSQANGYTWWNVNFDAGVDGWAVADYLSPVNTAGQAVGLAPGSELAATAPLRVRLFPSLSGQILGVAGVSATGTMLDGPIAADDHAWVKAKFKNGLEGWAASAYLSVNSQSEDAQMAAVLSARLKSLMDLVAELRAKLGQ